MQLKQETGAKQVCVEKGLERKRMYPVAAGTRSKPWGWFSSWGYGKRALTDTKELFSFPLKTLQPT